MKSLLLLEHLTTTLVFGLTLENKDITVKTLPNKDIPNGNDVSGYNWTSTQEAIDSVKENDQGLSAHLDPTCAQLIQASKEGNTSAVKALLSKGCDPNIVNGNPVTVDGVTDYNWTPLIEATFNDHPDVVQLLLFQANISVSKKSNGGLTALHAATYKGDASMVKDLLDNGADVNSVIHGVNWTPLIAASFYGITDVVKVLLQEEAVNLEINDSLGQTALILAAGKGHGEVVEALLGAGARAEVTFKTLAADLEFFKTVVTVLQDAGAELLLKHHS